MQLFLDCEFTGLVRDAGLIAIALYGDEANYFYAEFNDYNATKLSDWHIENVIKKLEFEKENKHFVKEGPAIKIKNDTPEIVKHLKLWLQQFDKAEIWGDVPHYDWMLFCDLFGGALNMPKNIHYICRDIATLLLAKNVDIDITRTEFVRNELTWVENKQHHALFDAMVGKLCYEKLVKM